MQPIKANEFGRHLQTLRQILKKRVEAPDTEVFVFEPFAVRNGITEVRLKANQATKVATDDFDRQVVCAVLKSLGSRDVLCTYAESWNNVGKDRFQFRRAAAYFFLSYGKSETKQIFRLEWENWELHDAPTKAAYPHWQFDRWLTGSDAEALATLKAKFEEPAEKVFESAEAAVASRPELGWFTRVHFPVSAQWATTTQPVDLNRPGLIGGSNS